VTFGTVPYIDMSNSDRFVGYPGLPRPPVSSVTNTAVDTTGYLGFLNAPINVDDVGVFTNVTFTTNTTNVALAVAVLELTNSDTASTNPVLRYVVTNSTGTYTNTNTGFVLTNLPVRSVVMMGAPLGDLEKPVLVVANTNISTLTLSNSNERRVYFSIFDNAAITNTLRVVATNVNWDIGITARNVSLIFATASFGMQGGFRVNQGVTSTVTAPTLTPENDAGGLDVIADRMMWLEDNRSL
jgi:hypothetical protein